MDTGRDVRNGRPASRLTSSELMAMSDEAFAAWVRASGLKTVTSSKLAAR